MCSWEYRSLALYRPTVDPAGLRLCPSLLASRLSNPGSERQLHDDWRRASGPSPLAGAPEALIQVSFGHASLSE